MKNTYNLLETHAELVITSKKHGTKTILIDLEDVPLAQKINWSIIKASGKRQTEKFYAFKNSGIYLHRILINTPPNLVTNHINANTLDCRKQNLEAVTMNQNAQHKNVPGVCYDKNKKRFCAYIDINGKTYQKTFATLEEAWEFRRLKEIELFTFSHKTPTIPTHIVEKYQNLLKQ